MPSEARSSGGGDLILPDCRTRVCPPCTLEYPCEDGVPGSFEAGLTLGENCDVHRVSRWYTTLKLAQSKHKFKVDASYIQLKPKPCLVQAGEYLPPQLNHNLICGSTSSRGIHSSYRRFELINFEINLHLKERQRACFQVHSG